MDIPKSEDRGALLACLLEMGELLLDCGAEVSRVEDTIRRLGRAYGAERLDVFVIPSIISIGLVFPGCEALTETRRIRSGGATDFYRLEKLNALSRGCCAEPLPLAELRARLDKVASGKKPAAMVYGGNAAAAFGFTVFFGGTVWDALAAAAFALLISFLQRRLGRTELNPVAGNLVLSLLTGLGVGALTLALPALHMDMILIGDIMLMIPGLAMTNAVRNMLVGDTISGVVRLAESLIWAGALAGGFMLSMLALQLLR
ncbi:MAG: threonine/serine exporter family protein [Oscillospiraceae bacterium]|nr:threonine/serine exporter family protein [Oscillospiraceae bacterium]